MNTSTKTPSVPFLSSYLVSYGVRLMAFHTSKHTLFLILILSMAIASSIQLFSSLMPKRLTSMSAPVSSVSFTANDFLSYRVAEPPRMRYLQWYLTVAVSGSVLHR